MAFTSIKAERSATMQNLPFDKVIIWGCKLHSHTHSYIHWAFYRAFKHMGYDTYWLDNNDTISFNFANSLFITWGGSEQKIPLRDDCFYILHNCRLPKYKELYEKGRCITLQVYTHDLLSREVEKLDDYIYYSVKDQILYMPWATDLLPHEIDEIKKQIPKKKKSNGIAWIGTIWSGIFGNTPQLDSFKKACRENKINFRHITRCSMEQNIEHIQSSYMAPAIQGKWQCDKGYIPCRIFKNISYGQFGITNSKTVYDLFKGKIVYNSDTYQLFYDAQKKLQNLDINELYELMDFVKTKHTYINRIKDLLDLLAKVYQEKNK